MNVTIWFDNDEKDHATVALRAFDLWSALHDIDDMCRNRMKHDGSVSDQEYQFLSNIREECNVINEFNIR